MSQVARGLAYTTIGFLTLVGEAVALPLAPTRPSDLVTATGSSGSAACPITGYQVDTRLLADGTSTPFVIPTGKVFVLTSYEFHSNYAAPDGSHVLGQISLQTPVSIGFVSTTGAIMADFNGYSHVQIPSGVAVTAQAKLCLTGGGPSGADLTVHGFFAKDR